MSKGFDQIRLVFDRYLESSLKARARSKRTGGKEVQYKITDETNIEQTPLKDLILHIKTKQDLTIFLAKHIISRFTGSGTNFVVTYDLCSETNLENYPIEMLQHDHEEADTLLILQAIDAAKTDPFRECIVYSPDTDVFLLLIYYYESLPQ